MDYGLLGIWDEEERSRFLGKEMWGENDLIMFYCVLFDDFHFLGHSRKPTVDIYIFL